jgi:hypothetical protein
VDYTRPYSATGRIEVGVRTGFESADDDRLAHTFEQIDGELVGSTTERGIAQRQFTGSVYTTVRQSFGNVSAQVGVRAENRGLEFDLPTGETITRNDVDYFPSANVAYRVDGRQLRLSYSRRIGRPGVSVLNPIDTSTDPAARRVGNPDIEPRYTHSINLHASISGAYGNVRLAPYYQRTVNDWAPITTVDAQGVSTRTYENLLSGESYGASLTWSMRQRDGWGGNVSVSGRQTTRDASNLADRYSGSFFRWSTRANLNARIFADLTAQTNLRYSPPTDLPQGRSSAEYRADMGVRYRILDGRGSVRLSLEDPFGVRGSSSRLQDLTYIQIGRNEPVTGSAQLSVSYSFGSGGGRMRGR